MQTNNPSIDWCRFEDKYVRLEVDVEKKVKLSQWRDGVWFGKEGLSFAVAKEDGQEVAKQFTTVSRKLIQALKPLLIQATVDGKDAIEVAITRRGEGFETDYEVRPLNGRLNRLLKRKAG